jgi:hypothetical protein
MKRRNGSIALIAKGTAMVDEAPPLMITHFSGTLKRSAEVFGDPSPPSSGV